MTSSEYSDHKQQTPAVAETLRRMRAAGSAGNIVAAHTSKIDPNSLKSDDRHLEPKINQGEAAETTVGSGVIGEHLNNNRELIEHVAKNCLFSCNNYTSGGNTDRARLTTRQGQGYTTVIGDNIQKFGVSPNQAERPLIEFRNLLLNRIIPSLPAQVREVVRYQKGGPEEAPFIFDYAVVVQPGDRPFAKASDGRALASGPQMRIMADEDTASKLTAAIKESPTLMRQIYQECLEVQAGWNKETKGEGFWPLDNVPFTEWAKNDKGQQMQFVDMVNGLNNKPDVSILGITHSE